MEKCVFFPRHGWKERVLEKHPLLEKIPGRLAAPLFERITYRFYAPILAKQEEELEIGYIMDIPYFILSKESDDQKRRERNFRRLIAALIEKNIKWICMSEPENIFTSEELEWLADEDFHFVTGEKLRTASLVEVFQRIMKILSKNMDQIHAVIMDADSPVGEDWTYLLGPFLNHLLLQGKDRKILQEIADILLMETGLSAEVSLDPINSFDAKELIVITNNENEWLPKIHGGKAIIINAGNDYEKAKAMNLSRQKGIHMESAVFRWLEGYSVNLTMQPKEKLLLTEWYLICFSNEYQRIVNKRRMDMMQIKGIQRLMDENGIQVTGIIDRGKELSFNQLRKQLYG